MYCWVLKSVEEELVNLSMFWSQSATKIYKRVSAIKVERKPRQGVLAEMLLSRLFFISFCVAPSCLQQITLENGSKRYSC